MFKQRATHLTGVFGLLMLAAYARAADPESQEAAADATELSQVVLEALQAEADGDLVKRERLLTQAANADSASPAAQWHRGFFKTEQGEWQSVEAYLAANDALGTLAAYEARRKLAPENAIGQWELAVWCLNNGFPEQARAHLMHTVELAPDHADARRLLGFQLVAGQWISQDQQKQYIGRVQAVQAGLAKYGKQLSELIRDFNSRDALVRGAAKERLVKIQDPLAIAPMEAILGGAGLDAAQAVVTCLSTIADPEASKSLVRFAMSHPHPQVQQAAMLHVKKRPYHDYVPALLELVTSPVGSMTIPVVSRTGTLIGFRQAFAQGHERQNEVLVRDTQINYFSSVNLLNQMGVGMLTRVRPDAAPEDLASQMEAYERSMERVNLDNAKTRANNELIAARNQMVARLLSQVTGRTFTGEASEIWKWWDEVNETEYQALRLSNVRYTVASLASRNYAEANAAGSFGSSVVRRHSCFVRGTPVVTRKGLQPIETIRVGDTVLSRDIRSGELKWKAVLSTTHRQPRPIVSLSLDAESLGCTSGHLFWVSGTGWTKASELRPGDILHAADQPIVVMKITQKPDEETFNLVVDETHSYFVGKQMVLSHDVTDRAPTYIKVPGLPVASAN